MIKKTFFIIFFFTMFNNSFASTKFDIIENFRKIDDDSLKKEMVDEFLNYYTKNICVEIAKIYFLR